MKKTILCISAILFALALNASPVGIEKARNVAAQRLKADESALLGSMDAAEAHYYIFNNPEGGFAIISGDDCLTPILGYSTKGSFKQDNMPENLRYWLGQVSSAVEAIREIGVKPLKSTMEEWARPVRPATKAAGDVILELPTWYQETPYNYYCPRISGESGKSMTGCVATAISMIMRYFEWPPCGTGTLPDYHMYYESRKYTGYYYMPGHALGHEYKWSLMPMTDVSTSNSNYTPTEGEKQIAWLMYDCGIMMQAMYSYEGTGAYSEEIPYVISEYMHYKNARYVKKEVYHGDWVSLMKSQIDRGLPVIYGANDITNGGHQFVVCGYDANDKLYVNWGWGGDDDGFYAVSDFIPPSMGYRFTEGHDAIVNLEPDRSYSPVPVEQEEPMVVTPSKSNGPDEPEYDVPSTVYLQGDTYGSSEYYGIELVSGEIEEGSTFTMKAGVLKNPTSARYTGYFRFDHCNYDGTFIGTLGYYKKNGSVEKLFVNRSNSYYVANVSCSVSSPISLGDKIILSTSTDNTSTSTWTQVPWIPDDYTLGEYPMISMGFINPDTKDTLVNTAEVMLYCDIENLGDSVRASVDYEDGSTEVILLEL